jgi:hypothetical protein
MPLSGNSEAGGMTLIGSGQIPTAGAFLNRKPRATANGAAPTMSAAVRPPSHLAHRRSCSFQLVGGAATARRQGAIKSRVVVLDKAAMQDILLSLHAFDDEDSAGQDSQREKKYHRDDH